MVYIQYSLLEKIWYAVDATDRNKTFGLVMRSEIWTATIEYNSWKQKRMSKLFSMWIEDTLFMGFLVTWVSNTFLRKTSPIKGNEAWTLSLFTSRISYSFPLVCVQTLFVFCCVFAVDALCLHFINSRNTMHTALLGTKNINVYDISHSPITNFTNGQSRKSSMDQN